MGAKRSLALWLAYLLSGEKTVALLRETWKGERPEYPTPIFANMVREGYRKNELIFACIETLADTAAQLSLRVYRPGDQVALEDHPLRRLIQHPNPFMSEYDFWASIITYQKLAGRAFYEKERTRGGQVVALWPLRPDWVQVVPSATTMIAGYTYGPPGQQPVALRAEDVLDFQKFDPLDRYQAHPPVAVAARVGDVDNSTTDFLKLFMEKGGVPPGLIKVKKKLDAAGNEAARLRRLWRDRYGGIEGWIDPVVLDEDAEYQKTGLNFEEMGFEVLDARNEARICAVLRVPPIIVGAKVGLDAATYSNYETAEKAWWRNTLLPSYANLQDVIENGLVPEFGGSIDVRWDTSAVYALQEDQQRRWTRAGDGLRAGGITVNMYLQEIGKPPIGPAGDVFLRPLTVIEVPARARGSAALIPAPKALPSGEPDHKRAQPPDRTARREAEAEIRDLMADYFAGQARRIESELADRGAG